MNVPSPPLRRWGGGACSPSLHEAAHTPDHPVGSAKEAGRARLKRYGRPSYDPSWVAPAGSAPAAAGGRGGLRFGDFPGGGARRAFALEALRAGLLEVAPGGAGCTATGAAGAPSPCTGT